MLQKLNLYGKKVELKSLPKIISELALYSTNSVIVASRLKYQKQFLSAGFFLSFSTNPKHGNNTEMFKNRC